MTLISARAALLALIQLVCCIGLVLVSQRLSGHFSVGFTQSLVMASPGYALPPPAG